MEDLEKEEETQIVNDPSFDDTKILNSSANSIHV